MGRFYKGGISPQDAYAIFRWGFQPSGHPAAGQQEYRPSGRYAVMYVTTNLAVACGYGLVVLEVRGRRELNILDAEAPPDPDVIRYHRREFGHRILKGDPIRKVLPRNKTLTPRELVALVRYRRRHGETEAVERENRALLGYAGYDGYGDLTRESGIEVFRPELLVPSRVAWVDAYVRDGEEPLARHVTDAARRQYGRYDWQAALARWHGLTAREVAGATPARLEELEDTMLLSGKFNWAKATRWLTKVSIQRMLASRMEEAVRQIAARKIAGASRLLNEVLGMNRDYAPAHFWLGICDLCDWPRPTFKDAAGKVEELRDIPGGVAEQLAEVLERAIRRVKALGPAATPDAAWETANQVIRERGGIPVPVA